MTLSSSDESAANSCRCGFALDHPYVVEKATYSIGGWLLICIGISAFPQEVILACDRCKFIFSRTKELEKRRKHQYK